ncbi:hypothetical protein CY34DRAFT_811350 [Suillus luteus UH-Slu-Lm8-n1]|uniref:Uncharacterized protein n=1 Tax=Suillus luteus UH-Slu-Lm8-n1 TaxID=930992 RepID=A0A0D0A3Y0_9AGAM|nr:hypothetical protein CY34DRAFT_811350 [Suillus luteus UH-Slu-Lm8-n1]
MLLRVTEIRSFTHCARDLRDNILLPDAKDNVAVSQSIEVDVGVDFLGQRYQSSMSVGSFPRTHTSVPWITI